MLTEPDADARAGEGEFAFAPGGRVRKPVIGGVVPFSTVDWPGKLAAVIFVAGCPWRCGYCHNPHLQKRHGQHQWDDVLRFLQSRVGLLDGVVLSGGEPTVDPACERMLRDVRALGFELALHTAGMAPSHLASALPYVQWVGIDIKTSAAHYAELTGRRNSAAPVQRSLDLLLRWGGAFECRTTWSPDWLAESELLDLAQGLAEQGVRQYALQRYRPSADGPPVAGLSDESRQRLLEMFEHFSYR